MFIILLAALANVDREQLDAASIDGANRCQSFRHVMLPAIWPVMVIACLIRGLDLFRIFDVGLAADPRRPGQRDRDLVDLRLHPRLSGLRDQLHRAPWSWCWLLVFSALVMAALRRVRLAR